MYSGALMSAKLRPPPGTSHQRKETLKPRRSQAKRQWSIQAVKGKVTTSCLWNACKALTIGILLMFVGAAMATIGYYAEEEQLRLQEANHSSSSTHVVVTTNTSFFPPPPHTFGQSLPHPEVNLTRSPAPQTPVESDAGSDEGGDESDISHPRSSGSPVVGGGGGGGDGEAGGRSGGGGETSISDSPFGLNKLTYVGPIVMGVGGFVIVAACVMTFEARDSAAKIVPAGFRKTYPERPRQEDTGFRNSASQTKWETLGVYGPELMRHSNREVSRRAMTSAFIQFSKTIQSSMDSAVEYYEHHGHRPLIKCPSAPSLIREVQHEDRRSGSAEVPQIHHILSPVKTHKSHGAGCGHSPRRRLTPNILPRQAMSVDNPAVREVYASVGYPAFISTRGGDEDLELGASATGVHQADSDASMALDLHLPQCSVTLAVRDQSRSPSRRGNGINGDGDLDEPCVSTPLLETDEQMAIPGPSGLQPFLSLKLDKQTSTSDYLQISTLGSSRDTWGSVDAPTSRHTTGGGSFREPRRPRPSRKVRRSETIDAATGLSRRNSAKSSHVSRTGSVRSTGQRSGPDGRRLVSIRSETARRHQLLRQQKVEGIDSQEDIVHHGSSFNV
ncbi:uncharacterized protein LOC143033356 [Oratosquilla oratoria]|uniref:uncharacterized protein LOC143033356 n=1 Tax=Oratosquilla oratoria TaxID=337810 RepID=UPI003F774312